MSAIKQSIPCGMPYCCVKLMNEFLLDLMMCRKESSIFWSEWGVSGSIWLLPLALLLFSVNEKGKVKSEGYELAWCTAAVVWQAYHWKVWPGQNCRQTSTEHKKRPYRASVKLKLWHCDELSINFHISIWSHGWNMRVRNNTIGMHA